MRSLIGAAVNAFVKPRNAAATTTPVPFARDGVYSARMFAGSYRDRDSEMRAIEDNGLLFSIVNRTSTAVAALTWHLYEKTPNREVTTDRVEVFNHASVDLLAKPNPFMSGPDMFETCQQHIDLTGEGYLVVAKNSRFNLPLELWPVMPHRMEPVPSSTSFRAGWIYTGPNGEQIPLRNDEVIQLKMPHPRDPYRGLGPVQAMLTQLDSARFSVEWNRNFFRNSAQPGGIIQVDKRLSDDEFDEMVARWNEQHRGTTRAHRVAIIEQGEWITNAQSMVDMQFAELQTQSRDRLLESFGMSGSVLGVTEDVNRANAEAGKAMFAELLTTPRGVRWRGAINAQLMPMYGATSDGLEWDFDSPVPADVEMDNATRASKAQFASLMTAAGYDPEQVLDAAELPKMKYVGRPASTAPPQFPPAPPPNDDDGNAGAPVEDRIATHVEAVLQRAQSRLRAAASPDLTQVDQQWQAATAQALADYQAQILPTQRQQLMTQIRQDVDDGHIAELASLSVPWGAAAALLYGAMNAYAVQAGQQAASEAAQQGATGVQGQSPDQKTLQQIADATAAILAAALALSAAREAMRIAATGATGAQVANQVGAFLEALSPASVQQELAGAMSAAQNKARLATFIAGPRCDLIASEILDTNTCSPCEQIDGRLFGSSDDPAAVREADAAYPVGGYIHCQGQSRCRGTLIADYGITAAATPGASDPTVIEMLKQITELLQAQVPARVNGHAKAGV